MEAERRADRELERGGVIDRVHLETAEEVPGVRLLALAPERAGGERRLPAHGRKRPGERPRDLRRATAREEEQRRNHPAARRRAPGLAPMPSPPVACSLHRDDSRTSSGHQRACNLVPRTSLARQGFRSARLSEGRSARGKATPSTRKLLSPPAFRSRVRRERARTLLGSRRLLEKEKARRKGRRRPFSQPSQEFRRIARLRGVPPSPGGACAGAVEGIGRRQPRQRSCAWLRSDVLLGPTPGRCRPSRQLARTARCEEEHDTYLRRRGGRSGSVGR